MRTNTLREVRKTVLFITLFDNENQWHILLAKHLESFLSESISQFDINYVIHFSKQKGDNIGLTVNIDSDKAKYFLRYADRSFKDYVNNKKSEYLIGKSLTNLEVRLFSNFSTNNILYGLHCFLPQFRDDIPSFNYRFIKIWERSSSSLINHFKDTQFTIEDLFSVGLHLNIFLLLTNSNFLSRYETDPVSLLNDKQTMREYIYKYQENRELISEIMMDCKSFVEGCGNENLSWIINWVDDINAFIKETSIYYSSRNINIDERLYDSIITVFRKQLGINVEGSILMDYFLFMQFKSRTLKSSTI